MYMMYSLSCKKAQTGNKQFVIKNQTTTDRKYIIQSFNDFYVHIGPSLVKKIPDSNMDPISHINKHNACTIGIVKV